MTDTLALTPGRGRLMIAAAAPLVLVALLVWRWSTVDAGTDAMVRADRLWLLGALLSVGLTWVAGSCCQMGATIMPLPMGRVFATQVAGSFVNHVLPAGVGVAALNLRMLRKCGLTRAGAAGAVGLNAAAGFIVHAIALVALLLVFGARGTRLDRTTVLAIAGGVLVGAVILGLLALRLAPQVGRTLRTALAHPGRAAMLWVGSAAVPALHIVTLAAVLQALDRPVAIGTLAVAYLGASAVASIIPSPGGFGGLDVALLAALTATGITASAAAAAVIGYRLLTVWLPLLPGAATLVLLLHRRII
jgi:uncharacterized membrane protein YbhN (UPF0104 family)